MPRLTYRGNVYQPSEKRSEKLSRVHGASHTYRGAVYHYASKTVDKSKEDTSLAV